MMLRDDMIRLRAVEPADIDLLYDWENDTSLWDVGITLAPYSRKQLRDYVDSYTADIYASRQLRLMVSLLGTDETVGTVDLYDFDPVNGRAGVGVLIAAPWQRRGIGLRALNLIADYCQRKLSMHQLYCIVGADNRPSRALFEAAGYKTSGRLRSWLLKDTRRLDAFIMQRLL